MNEFFFCPKCAHKSIKLIHWNKWVCSNCGFELYNNTASAVGAIIFDEDDNVLFERRARNPRQGFFALPGGFVNYDESAEDAVVRECYEELGVNICDVKYVCSFPNTYEYKNIVYKTCDLFFSAKIKLEQSQIEQNENSFFSSTSLEKVLNNMNISQKEVSELALFKVKNKSDIEKIPLAFDSAKNALSFWLK